MMNLVKAWCLLKCSSVPIYTHKNRLTVVRQQVWESFPGFLGDKLSGQKTFATAVQISCMYLWFAFSFLLIFRKLYFFTFFFFLTLRLFIKYPCCRGINLTYHHFPWNPLILRKQSFQVRNVPITWAFTSVEISTRARKKYQTGLILLWIAKFINFHSSFSVCFLATIFFMVLYLSLYDLIILTIFPKNYSNWGGLPNCFKLFSQLNRYRSYRWIRFCIIFHFSQKVLHNIFVSW